MFWESTIETLTTWYWLVIIAFLLVGLAGTYIHQKAMPILWAVIMSIVLYAAAGVLEPLIFGYQYYATYSIEWIMTASFGVLFAALNIIYGYNILTKGTVIE